ncbi:fimbrial protein [Providencia rustigianii]|uniref:fimbrial protein n=1 Tax=Providencia rustigianii TaxID=158850 RepID=UPI000F6CC1CC|nr:fimbrial protein [Providencia rustigianii]MTC61459.1 fimbrial protein [Providencia rustigianii]VEH56759.1 Fimbria A protein precursor [Providencia rustigianii]
MKKIILTVLISGAMSSSAMSATVNAGQGTVTFFGSIIDAPCGIAPESTDQSVNLGQIASAQLSAGGTSRPVPFKIELVDCDITTKKSAEATFTGGPNTSLDNALAIQGTASGAGVVITGINGLPVKIDGSEGAGVVSLQNGDNTLLFSAYLQGDKTVIKPGEFTAIANFTMQYP